jgi:FlaA1/EpsC-like NDP-sugar epimerase
VSQDRRVTGSRVSQVHKRVSDHRRSIAFLIYGGITLLAYTIAYLLRFEFVVPPYYKTIYFITVLPVLSIRVATFSLFRLTRERWRFASVHDLARLIAATLAGTAVFGMLDLLVRLDPRVPLSVLIIEPVLTIGLISSMWLAYRMGFELRNRGGNKSGSKRVVVIGAGEAGNVLVREMLRSNTGYDPVAFVDDDPAMSGASVHGVQVAGCTTALETVARVYKAEELIIAVPSASPTALRAIVEACERTLLPYKVLPGMAAVFAGKITVEQLRDVQIEDLLGREPVNLHLPELAEDLAGCVVLITGAAGSIGSELARQVAIHNPRTLILLDQAETPLFFLELELREVSAGVAYVPVVCDVCDSSGIEEVFVRYKPDRVFHAAAYKHVPMMEQNPREAVRNNVLGTWYVASASGMHGAERFVLVSTDKAVRPANIMGATKRLAEIIILELQDEYPKTAFGAVRFGNVLGSAGSVVPIFKRQIEKGVPLTITHPDMTRFFMTIPEASQLILHCSLLTEFRGHISMLEMGEPVRILDLAENLLRLSGYTGDLSDRIAYTGIRPGEKMHEELVAPEEDAVQTPLEKVMILSTAPLRASRVTSQLRNWDRQLAQGKTDAVLAEIKRVFPAVRIPVPASLQDKAIDAAS